MHTYIVFLFFVVVVELKGNILKLAFESKTSLGFCLDFDSNNLKFYVSVCVIQKLGRKFFS